MDDSDTRSSRPQRGRLERTVVFDTQWPHFKRTLSKQPGGLGAGIPFSPQTSRARKSPRGAASS